MITAVRKPLNEIIEMVVPYEKILVTGCGTCVTIDYSGGAKEAAILASQLRIARRLGGKKLETLEQTVERQCEWEFVKEFTDHAAECQAIISMACGAGIQTVAAAFPDKPVFPGVNTRFIGMPQKQGVWEERCICCGNCVLHLTGGLCPFARCAKTLLNGPCEGSQDGKCEVNRELDCVWQQIYDSLKERGRLADLQKIFPLRDWSTGEDGGYRITVREDMML